MTYEQALHAAAIADDRLVVLTAENRAAIRGLPEALGPRFIDFGISEQTMVGAAAGLALRGRIPVAHALATFLTLRAFEFIRTDVGIPGLPVKLIGGVPGFLSEANGPTHQAIEDVALMRAIPGMQIVCPSDEEELVAALPEVLNSPAPTYVRYVGGPARVEHRTPFVLGRAERLREGHDLTVLTYGLLVAEAASAVDELRPAGDPRPPASPAHAGTSRRGGPARGRGRDPAAGHGGGPPAGRWPGEHRRRVPRPPGADDAARLYRARGTLVPARPARGRLAHRAFQRSGARRRG